MSSMYYITIIFVCIAHTILIAMNDATAKKREP